ncbi:MAG TPA: IS1380 family transposase [Gemmatimonadaceae bacterium]|nr:IS1380 family transposase [Gemmatimonadaceae bacterium]
MNTKVRDEVLRRQRRNAKRLKQKGGKGRVSVLDAGAANYEVSSRIVATSAGGVRLVHDLARAVRLPQAIDERLDLLKIHRPYHESDHVLSLAYNLLAGGTCIEDLEQRRSDDAFLDMLGVDRIPDPTTAGDFCRRFGSKQDVDALQDGINESRLRVWRRQPKDFFAQAIVDADGTIAETTGECKEGMDMSFKGQWGYQHLVVSLANTQEVLFQDLRPGNRPSHEGAAERLDQAVALLRRGGFERILMRGDTAFSQTAFLDRWDDDCIEFVFGIQAGEKLCETADSLPDAAWTILERKPEYVVQTSPRSRPRNVKADIVMEREYYNQHLCREDIAEFDYRPSACQAPFRIVVLRKVITHERGQQLLHAEHRYLFYITNTAHPATRVVELANERCNQERTIGELKSGVNALRMPLGDLLSNWAYSVIATLAWNLSRWIALALPARGRWKDRHADEKRDVLRMRFRTFVQRLMLLPAQVVTTGRRLVVRLLDWNPWRHVFFRAIESVQLTT